MPLVCTTLVLDLDGTISDPSTGIARSINYALVKQGFMESPEAQIAKEIGEPLDEIFIKLESQVTAKHVPKLVADYRERYAQTGFAENTIYPGMYDLLTGLRTAGIKLGICTSKRRDFAVKIAALFDLSAHFEFISGGDIGVTKQQQLATLLQQGQIDNQAVMVGDRAIDILAAQHNGLASIGVSWGFGGYQELASASPDQIVDNVEALGNAVKLLSE